MKKIVGVLLCCLLTITFIGCGNKQKINNTIQKDETKNTISNNTNTKENNKLEPSTIEENYQKSITKQFPEIQVVKIDLISDPHLARFGIEYQGDKSKTMKKMAEIQVASEAFFKTQKIEYIYYGAFENSTTDKGNLFFHLEDNEYKMKDATLQ